MIYQLQSVRSNRAGFECLGQLAKTTRHLFANKLELDMSQVSSFDANMAAPLGVVLARATDKFNAVSIAYLPIAVKEMLTNNQFLTHFQYSCVDASPARMPFRRFRLTDEGAFEEYVHRMLTDKDISAMSEKVIQRFRQIVFEVYQNAVIHSESEIGILVCGQSFVRDNRLHFTIADGGIGIREAVRRYFGNRRISSIQAVKWALESQHTTKRNNHPGGLGFQFIKKLSTLNQGRVWIVSRFAFYEYHRGHGKFEKMKSDFPGTAVTIEINTEDTGRYFLSSEVS